MCVFLFSACAVYAMLCEVVGSGVSSRVKSDGVDEEEVKGDMEFDVVLCQSELTERALQLCHLLPPGFMPVSLNSYHTATRNPVCLIQWMFNGAEQPFILLWCPYLCQRGFKLFVCTLCLCVFVCEYVRAPSDWLSGLRIWARDAIPFSVCLPFISAAALSCLYSLQLCFLTPFLTKKYHFCSHPSAGHFLFCSSDLCYISTTHLMLSVSCLLRYVRGWSCSVPLTLRHHWASFSPPLSPALSVIPEFLFGCSWQFGPLWDPGYGRSKINLHFFP